MSINIENTEFSLKIWQKYTLFLRIFVMRLTYTLLNIIESRIQHVEKFVSYFICFQNVCIFPLRCKLKDQGGV